MYKLSRAHLLTLLLPLCLAGIGDMTMAAPAIPNSPATLVTPSASPINMARVQQTLHLNNCERYPYGTWQPYQEAAELFKRHFQQAVNQGLQCLSGHGPMGKLHPYHERQGYMLGQLLESNTPKTFACVADAMYANAVATQQHPLPDQEGLAPILGQVEHPAVVMDVYRIGGLLSRQHGVQTYREFFNLNDDQIKEHLTGHPIRMDSSHRYANMPSLLFHEMVHWLGHSHSYIYPDVAHLYETCCFGGSDYISDSDLNSQYQEQACDILRDDELWSANRYQKARQWHYKGYDLLKGEMRTRAD